MMVLGLAFAIILGIIFSDEAWSRFIGPGVLFGLSSTASIRKRHLTSLVIFAGGILWLLQIIRWDDVGWLPIAAGALVVVGLLLWFFGSHRGSGNTGGGSGQTVVGSSVVETSEDTLYLGGAATNTRRIVTSQAFEGGEVSVSLGKIEVDFTSAKLAEGGASLSLSSQMASITLRVPADWVVEINGSFTMGAVKDERSGQPTEGPTLRLNVHTTMGEVQITD
jgi:hypothetical protein